MNKQEYIDKVRAFAQLKAGWSSYSSNTISDKAIETAIKIIDESEIIPEPVPRFNGGIQIELHRNNLDIEIEIEPDGSVSSVFIAE